MHNKTIPIISSLTRVTDIAYCMSFYYKKAIFCNSGLKIYNAKRWNIMIEENCKWIKIKFFHVLCEGYKLVWQKIVFIPILKATIWKNQFCGRYHKKRDDMQYIPPTPPNTFPQCAANLIKLRRFQQEVRRALLCILQSRSRCHVAHKLQITNSVFRGKQKLFTMKLHTMQN